MPARNSPAVKPLLSFPIILFAVLSTAFFFIGALFVQTNVAVLMERIQQELASIADLKRSQIIQWRDDRLANASDIANSLGRHQVKELLRDPTDFRLRDSVLSWFHDQNRFRYYRSVTLLNDSGTTLLSTNGEDYRRDTMVMRAVAQSLGEGTPVFTDIHVEPDRETRFHIAVPVPYADRHNRIGHAAIILGIDPSRLLFPLIQKWPLPSRSSETLIFRREGDKVLYLNELRFNKGSALKLTRPISTPHLLAAKALRGDTGISEGVDYRGVPVVGAILDIPGTSWHMVAKIDKDEIIAPARKLFLVVFALVMALIALAAAGLAFVQRQRKSKDLETRLLAERERSRLLESLAEQEREFRSLFEAMVEGAALHEIVKDATGKPIDYRILEVNTAFERQTGITASSARGALATELYRSSETPFLDIYAAVAETGVPNKFSTYFEPLDRYLSVSVFSHAPGRFATVFEDITEFKRYEEKIQLERERLLVTIRSIGDGVITTDIAGRVTLMNRVAEELTGWELSEAVGKPLAEVFNIINEHTRVKCENPVEKVLLTGDIVGLANHTALIRRDGCERSIADSGAPIRDRESRIIGVVLVFRDITEKLRADSALQNAQRLESIGILAGGIAHDFNNLLGGVFGYIDIARERAEEGDAQQAAHFIGKSLAVFDRAKSLTKQLLTFSKGGMPIRKTQHIGKLLRDSVHFVLSGSNVSVSLSIPENLHACDFDENQMAQVIDNITMNACQAMPAGGRVEVIAENIEGAAVPSALRPMPHIHIAIRDSGIGIAPEHLSLIFDPFFTTKQQGSGLGLAISYSIVKKHDGLIEVESAQGKGTTFHIYLPASLAETVPVEMEPDGIFHGRGRVLVMDDEEFLLEIGSDMLKGLGFEVVKAHHGDEACATVRDALERGKPIAFAILDLTIPGGKGGQEAAAPLRKIDPGIKLIASSGYADSPVIAEPARFGFDGKLIKPYRKNELAKEMKRVAEEGDK